MRLQIISDSHMQVDAGRGNEYGKFDFPVAAPNLALLGGLGRVCDTELFDFIVHQLGRYQRVFYVLGRDEFYGSDFTKTIHEMNKFAENVAKPPSPSNSNIEIDQKLGKFYFLHRTRVDFEDVTILGCSLWRIGSNKRGHYPNLFNPIKDFYAEEEEVERELDVSWLEAELGACANGEGPVRTDLDGGSTPEPPQPSALLTQEYMEEEEEGDIYNDEPMTPPPTQPAAETFTENVQTPDAETAKETSTNQETADLVPRPRQGHAKRVLVLTYFPPTYEETVHRKWKPFDYKNEDVDTLLKGRQCWALPNGTGNGVSVHSPIHGSGTPAPLSTEINQPEPSSSNEKTCTHNEAVDPGSDSLRPPGIAAWAFGYSKWSCDVQYDVNKPRQLEKNSYYHTKKPTPPRNLPCPSCKRVPAPVRMVSNQRGQQWERDRQVYIDVPAGWRTFDDSFVIDV
ncbi:hypothetical protein RhiJN_14638 [Ceratobasidium sp. AG-Ba]|nr:hypothetical protein RhiJN_14638 [Ceratobasidium sp. AG-Ba]QRW15176.1 hypothetical protein RhiLY_14175 [Ceratobasidium sp. AG-Ba]